LRITPSTPRPSPQIFVLEDPIPGKLRAYIWNEETRSHPEKVGDMSRVTVNFDFCALLARIKTYRAYSHQKLNMYIYWFSSESG